MRLPINTVLQTKDGRYMGNALIVSTHNSLYIIITDYGNKLYLSMREIDQYFYIGKITRPSHKYFVEGA